MKKLLTSLIILLSLQAAGQSFEFTDTTNEWYIRSGQGYYTGGHSGTTISLSHIYYSGREIINSIEYLVFARETSSISYYTKFYGGIYDTIDVSEVQKQPVTYNYVRRDSATGNIYVPSFDSFTKEYIRYPHNIQVGDIIKPWKEYTDSFVAVSIDSILINGTYHKRIYMEPTLFGCACQPYTVIEGIGSTSSPFGLTSKSRYHVSNGSKVICFKNRYGYLQSNELPDIVCLDTNISSYLPDTTEPKVDTLNEDSTNTNKIVEELKIYPQPAHLYFNIAIPTDLNYYNIKLYNYLGQLVLNKDINTGKTAVNIAHLPAGIYLYQVHVNHKPRHSGKLMFY